MRVMSAALLLLATCARADEGAAFLKLGVGARALGMGGAYTAVAEDVSAMGWNPAGLSGLAKKELGVTHAELALGSRFDFIGYAHPTSQGTLGAGLLRLDQGKLEGRDAAGKPTAGFGASDTALTVSCARKAGDVARVGANVRLIQSSLGSASAQTVALDLGALREFSAVGPGRPRLGVSIQNIGPGLRFLDKRDDLPLATVVGLGYRLPIGMILALDVRHRPNSRQTEVAVGTEYAILSGFALRGGYGSSRAAAGGTGVAALGGIAAGFGFKAGSYDLDYSITPMGELGQAQRFSLGCRF